MYTRAERNSFIIMEPVCESKLKKRTLSGQQCTTDHKDRIIPRYDICPVPRFKNQNGSLVACEEITTS